VRSLFMQKLIAAARKQNNIVLIIGDLGYSVVEEFIDEFPDRFFNAGIAEQNMMGMAAGLASEGCQVFTYSIGNFPTWRCAEQIRNDVDYHNCSVVNVVVGAGVTYGALGYSHHAVQDYALMRCLPNMRIASPGDLNETAALMDFMVSSKGPFYFRLGKEELELTFQNGNAIEDGGLNLVREGASERVVLTTGNVLSDVLNRDEFSSKSVFSVPLWSSKGRAKLCKRLVGCEQIVTVEDHLLDGGFGSWVREAFNRKGHQELEIINLAFDASICGRVGSAKSLRELIFE
jgi:transketolase